MGTESASLETKVRLQQCAVCEFMEKGFLKASLRSICREAGVTTGALYFFFQDKDDLFVSLVGDVLQQIQGMMQEHFDKERVEADGDTSVDLETGDYSEDEAVSKMIIHALYEQRDSALLLLTRSQGSSLEGAVDELIRVVTIHYRMLADAMTEKLGMEPLEESFVHWIFHMQIDTFIYMITHIEKEEEALRYIQQATHYMVNGWYGMFRSLGNDRT